MIGKGSFSVVHRGLVSKTSKEVALKFIDKSKITSEKDRMRLCREINILKNVNHPNIVHFVEFIQDNDYYIIVTELCNGCDLFDYIVSKEKLCEKEASELFYQVLKAIEYLHAMGIAHRDIKPQNIIIDRYMKAKIIDLGLCGIIEGDQMLNSFCGSPCYTPPECVVKQEYDGKKSDIWSLGVVLYEMLTGQHPWNINNSSLMIKQILSATFPIPPTISSEATNLILKMMQVVPNDRITVTDALNNQWFKINNSDEIIPEDSLPPLIRRSISLDIPKIEFQEIFDEIEKGVTVRPTRVRKALCTNPIDCRRKSLSNRRIVIPAPITCYKN